MVPPPFFADVTIRHPENDNAELFFHCGPFPESLADPDSPRRVSGHYILPDCTPGCAEWRIKGGDMTIARVDRDGGDYSTFIGHVRDTEGPFTRGTYVWAPRFLRDGARARWIRETPLPRGQSAYGRLSLSRPM